MPSAAATDTPGPETPGPAQSGRGQSGPGPSGRRGRPGYDQQSVLNVAVEVFNRHGYDATSMGILAENLGISKSAIYHHVPSKEDLLALALEQALGGLESVWEAPETKEGTAEHRLEFVVRSTVRVLTERLPFVTLLLRLRGNTETERRALERRRGFDRKVAELIEEARAEGTVRSDIDPRTVSRLLFGTINSIVEWYRPGGSLTPERLGDDLVAVLFDGLTGGRVQGGRAQEER